jgi:enoyl-CoA hydratase/carnithine racemase
MSDEIVSQRLEDEVAVIEMDDGKANAISQSMIEAINRALDRAEKEARAIVLSGRAGRFSGGFDLGAMRGGAEQARALVGGGAELALRLYGFSLPVVIACTGHAIAMGAVLLLSADTRLGADGDFKIGLNEVAIGLALPPFALRLAEARLSKRHLVRAALEAEIYAPSQAVDAGFLDRITSPEALAVEALAEAKRLAALDPAAFHATKIGLRSDTIARIRAEEKTLPS